MNSATHWLTTAFDGFVGFLPALVAGIVILVIGYVVGYALGRLAEMLLRKAHYDRFLARLGLIEQAAAEQNKGSRWTGKAVFWIVILAAIMQTARTWDLRMVSDGIARVIAYIPHLIGAAIVFGAALYFANWVRDRIAKREMVREGAGERPIVASLVRAAILALGAFMALRELQIAPEIVTIAFTLSLAAIALAGAIAFGMGSRGVAENVVQRWYEKRPSWNGSRRDVTPPGAPERRPSP